jgi:hypothetical protein
MYLIAGYVKPASPWTVDSTSIASKAQARHTGLV